MEILTSNIETIIKLIISLSVINVWVFRSSRPTFWRGGDANSMAEEFKAYGLSTTVMSIVGGLKILFSCLLLITLIIPPTFNSHNEMIEMVGLIGIATTMTGAIIMHIKINDAPIKSLPAFIFLLLSLFLLYLNNL